MDRTPGRIGFMSTQRRENRWRPTGCMDRVRAFGHFCLALLTRYCHALASVVTAPPVIPAWLATKSLQSDHRINQLLRLVLRNIPHSLSPPGAGSRVAAATAASFRSSFPHIPTPSGLAHLHPSLPRVPAAISCRTERYDGKRDLYLQHAA